MRGRGQGRGQVLAAKLAKTIHAPKYIHTYVRTYVYARTQMGGQTETQKVWVAYTIVLLISSQSSPSVLLVPL